jgi:hypothetical protein
MSKERDREYDAGEANAFLYDWTVIHTNPKYILAQEGIWMASEPCRDMVGLPIALPVEGGNCVGEDAFS